MAKKARDNAVTVAAIGLLFLPARAAAATAADGSAAELGFAPAWVVAAAVVGIASMLVLGPGIAVGPRP